MSNICRLSSEAAGFPNQQHEIAQEHFPTDNLIPQNLAVHSEFTMNHNQQQLKYYSFSPTSYCVLDFFPNCTELVVSHDRNAAEKGMQASDLLLAKVRHFHHPSTNTWMNL